jgi:hypothetical protein
MGLDDVEAEPAQPRTVTAEWEASFFLLVARCGVSPHTPGAAPLERPRRFFGFASGAGRSHGDGGQPRGPPTSERLSDRCSGLTRGVSLAEQPLGPGDLLAHDVEATLEVDLPLRVGGARQLLLHLGLAAAQPRQAGLHVAEQSQRLADASLP